ncbi:MAG TPA: serine hydrolase [Rubricoccaceae bacterium]|jgi:CubicO group peptidase (beta-lactamase class C family)
MRSVVALALVLLAPSVALAQGPRTLSDRLDAYLAPLVSARQFSGVVRVQRGDSVLYERAAGPRDAAGAPLRRDDVLRIGSVTKPMTAAVVLRLAARGEVALDSSACGITARSGVACPQGWSGVTVRHLLNQTAGLPDYTQRPTFAYLKNERAAPAELLASLRGAPLVNAPGAAFGYSNTHYVLLGAVVEAVTGRPFADVLADEVARPLGLTRTAMEGPGRQPVVGFQTVGRAVVPADSLDPSVAYAAGGAVSTAEDLAAFARAAVAGPFLTDATRADMLAPATESGYGLGWIAVPYRGPVPALQGTRVVWHNGGIDGFRSLLLTVPERDVTVVVLANLGDADADGVGRDVLHILYGLDVAPTVAETAVVLPPEALAGIEGVYRLAPGFDLTVRVEGTRVVTQATGQGEIELFASGPDAFFARAVPAQIRFTRGADGRAASLTLLQEGREMVAPRAE